MSGERIDYRLLRLIAHDRNKATEEELDERAQRSTFSVDDARAWLEKVRNVYFAGRLPVDPKLHYLDIGCGNGRLCIGLAAAGARNITGIEIVPRHVVEAETIARALPPGARPRFFNVDIHDWTPPRQKLADPFRASSKAGLPRGCPLAVDEQTRDAVLHGARHASGKRRRGFRPPSPRGRTFA